MTLPIYLDVHPNQNIKEINIDLNNQINHKAPLSNSLNSWILGLTPHFLLVLLIRLIQKMSTITGLYFSSGFLSDLGRYMFCIKSSFSFIFIKERFLFMLLY